MDEEHGAKVRVPPPLIFLGLTGLGAVLHAWVLPWPLPLRSIAATAVGVLTAIAGFALMFWAVYLFKKSGQDPKPWTPSPEVVDTGPYRFSRNPMYAGMLLVQLGLGVGLANA